MKIIKGSLFDQNNSGQDSNGQNSEGASYSKMVLDLIKPFTGTTPMPYVLRPMLDLGVVSWNMAISKSLGFPGYKDLFKTTMATLEIEKEDQEKVKKMVEAKIIKYPEFIDFIERYEIEDEPNGEGAKIKVYSKPMQDMMKDFRIDEDDFEDEMVDDLNDEFQYEEGFLNRNALTIKPKPSFWEWIAKHEKGFLTPTPPYDYNLYLINDSDSRKHALDWLKKNYDKIFINELGSWAEEDNILQVKRNYKMFTEFFEVEFHSAIWDFETRPVVKY